MFFFIGGVSSKQKRLEFIQTIICPHCGQYGRFEVIMEYMYFSLFFIPIVKWNKKYYVTTSCCGSVYPIDNEIGDRIARGEQVTLTERDLHLAQGGRNHYRRRCPNCGFETEEDFQYCPRCASPLK